MCQCGYVFPGDCRPPDSTVCERELQETDDCIIGASEENRVGGPRLCLLELRINS